LKPTDIAVAVAKSQSAVFRFFVRYEFEGMRRGRKETRPVLPGSASL